MSSYVTPQEILEMFNRACALAKARDKQLKSNKESKRMNYHNMFML